MQKMEISQLGTKRGEQEIFKNLGVCLPAGACLIIRGANGSGKTTLLKTLAGLLQPATGNFSAEGAISYLGHQSGLKSNMTLQEHLDFWGKLYNAELLIPVAIVFLRLEKELHTPCGQLSAGWQRRTALARLILSQSDIWLLDEPLNSLDDNSVEIILSLIATRCDQGGIVLMSYHGALKIPFGQVLQMEDFG